MQILLWASLILPWFSLVLLKKEDVKHYMPVTIFSCLLVTMIFEIAYTYNWWTLHYFIFPWGYITHATFVYGIFAVGALWIFYLTSHNFWIYLLTNLAVNTLFSFLILPWIIKGLKIATLNNFQYWQWFVITISISLIIYGYHRWQDKVTAPPKNVNEEKK